MSSTAEAALNCLADRVGIKSEFRNSRGETVRTSARTKRLLLAALSVGGVEDGSDADTIRTLDEAAWKTPLPPVLVSAGVASIEVVLPEGSGVFTWRLELEDGQEHLGDEDFATLSLIAEIEFDGCVMQRRRLPMKQTLPWGYHRLTLTPGNAVTMLIVTPAKCWLPPKLEAGHRIWGIAAQLYLLRSNTDWGIGDYGDLCSLADIASRQGADVIGLNPLHALFHDRPSHASPYSPASRLLLNVLNIDVPKVLTSFPSPAVENLVGSPHFQKALSACRSQQLVDYAAVARLKLSTLELLFDTSSDARHEERFKTFQREGGNLLKQNCLFLALHEHFGMRDGAADWRSWPQEYRDCRSSAVARFAGNNSYRILFLSWLQWLADSQLKAAAARANEIGMSVGLYRDLAIGADRNGAESWLNPEVVVSAARVGVPPDFHNPAGQNWGLPPFNPLKLREERYQSFIELVRANMRHAGGLRIDHVMGLQQLYWIPEGESAAAGAYVEYPIEDLLGILALESHRNQCLVVGEDLGTVPEGFSDRLCAANILSYRVLYFEQQQTGAFQQPNAYPPAALAVVGSHDLPTFRGWWTYQDIQLKDRLGLYPDAEEAQHQRETRDREKAELQKALFTGSLLASATDEPSIDELEHAVHKFLATTSSILAMVQIDDLTAEVSQVNVPATSDDHPNWRRRLSLTLEEIGSNAKVADILKLFADERGSSANNSR